LIQGQSNNDPELRAAVMVACNSPYSGCPILDGIGMAELPDYIVAEQVGSGSLEVVLPQWMFPVGVIHAVFASRRGLSPAVRSFLDFLAAEFRKWTETGSRVS
jgi:hypothetical protein